MVHGCMAEGRWFLAGSPEKKLKDADAWARSRPIESELGEGAQAPALWESIPIDSKEQPRPEPTLLVLSSTEHQAPAAEGPPYVRL